MLILPAILGIDGIWLAVTAAELAALAVSAAMFVTKTRYSITARRNLPCFLRNGEKQGIFLVILALPPARESC